MKYSLYADIQIRIKSKIEKNIQNTLHHGNIQNSREDKRIFGIIF